MRTFCSCNYELKFRHITSRTLNIKCEQLNTEYDIGVILKVMRAEYWTN